MLIFIVSIAQNIKKSKRNALATKCKKVKLLLLYLLPKIGAIFHEAYAGWLSSRILILISIELFEPVSMIIDSDLKMAYKFIHFSNYHDISFTQFRAIRRANNYWFLSNNESSDISLISLISKPFDTAAAKIG